MIFHSRANLEKIEQKMQTQNLQMSKQASQQRKSTLIAFDMDLEAEYETDSSIIHQKLKRQQNMVEDERH